MNPIFAQILGALGTLGLFLFGILLVAWDNANQAADTGPFSFKKFWTDNKDAFLRCMIYGVFIVVGLTYIHGIQDVLGYIGLNVTVPITGGGAALLGGLMYDRIRQRTKNKINVGPKQDN